MELAAGELLKKTDIFWLEKGMKLNACDIQIEQSGPLASCVKQGQTKMGIALENIRSSPGAKLDWFHGGGVKHRCRTKGSVLLHNKGIIYT